MTSNEKELMQDLINQASNKINSLQECIKEKDAEIKRLKAENAYLLKACEKQFTFDTTENKKYSVFNSVRKEFADEIKVLIFQKVNPYAVPFEEFVNANVFCIYIDELLKEYEK